MDKEKISNTKTCLKEVEFAKYNIQHRGILRILPKHSQRRVFSLYPLKTEKLTVSFLYKTTQNITKTRCFLMFLEGREIKKEASCYEKGPSQMFGSVLNSPPQQIHYVSKLRDEVEESFQKISITGRSGGILG